MGFNNIPEDVVINCVYPNLSDKDLLALACTSQKFLSSSDLKTVNAFVRHFEEKPFPIELPAVHSEAFSSFVKLLT